MSKFAYLFRIDAEGQREARSTPGYAQQSLTVWRAWIRQLEASGHLKDAGFPLEQEGGVVQGRQKLVTDGPYIEVKELVAGIMVVQARDLAEAIQLSTGCPILDSGGSVEVRPIMDVPA